MIIKLNCVLLVDDDDEDNYFHQLVLEESFSVDKIKIVENGLKALDFIRSAPSSPELIFLDANMPRMTGWEFIEEYKKLERKLHSVIIMLTTSLNPLDKQRAMRVPEISGFETKPLTPEAFDQILKRHFPKKRDEGNRFPADEH
jgi:CheY-like chemotaxis protein